MHLVFFTHVNPVVSLRKIKRKQLLNLEILASHYCTDDAPVNAQELRKEWESFSVMLVDHCGGAKTREVLCDLASDKLQAVSLSSAGMQSLPKSKHTI